MAVGDLYTLCRQLLEACVDALALTPTGAPGRQYVSPGAPAFDCNQITVHAGGTQEAYANPVEPPRQIGLRVETGKVNLVAVTVTVVRCLSVMDAKGNPPPAAKMDADAQVTLADLWVIWNHLFTVKKSGALYPPDHREMIFDPAVPLAIHGGVGGWEIPFRVQLDGFRTA